MWIKEEGWIEEEKGIMDRDRWFSLLEMLRLTMYALESSESSGWCVGIGVPVCRLSFLSTSYSFYKTKVAYFSR